MNRLSSRGEGRAACALAGAGFVGAMALLAGCGTAEIMAEALHKEQSEYDHYFFPELASTEDPAEARADTIKAEVERLATPTWEIARANIIAAGKDSIPWLIAALDRRDPTHVSLRPVPGPTTPEARGAWTLGQVAYSVLRDLVARYGTFEGSALPPLDKAAWETWWAASKKTLVVYTPEGTMPPHVRKQKEEIAGEIARRYTEREAKALGLADAWYAEHKAKGLEARKLDVAKTAEARAEKERERERRLEERKRKAREAREREDAERAVREAARARAKEAAAPAGGTEEAPGEAPSE